MSARWTKDERFIVCAYEAVQKSGDIDILLDRYEIGQLSGLTLKGVDAVAKQLHQANFIKLIGKTEMQLTKHGERLALRLLQE